LEGTHCEYHSFNNLCAIEPLPGRFTSSNSVFPTQRTSTNSPSRGPGCATDSGVATALNPIIKEPESTHGWEHEYRILRTSKPVSSLPSRATACSNDPPLFTYPALRAE